jgi:hypothetical protein
MKKTLTSGHSAGVVAQPVGGAAMEKGKNDLSRYKFSHEVRNPDKSGYDWMYVKGHDSVTGEQIAYTEISADPEGTKSRLAVPHNTWVHENHRRKGIASAMYQYAEKHLGTSLSPDSEQSADAKALWRQKGRPFGKSRLGKVKEKLEKAKKALSGRVRS